jgi:hypothetical protein
MDHIAEVVGCITEKQVLRVDARRYVAMMADQGLVGQLAKVSEVREPVRSVRAAEHSGDSVAFRRAVLLPDQASRFIGIRIPPKRLYALKEIWHSVLLCEHSER